MNTLFRTLSLLVALALGAAVLSAAPSKKPGFGEVYYEGELLTVILPPASTPKEGKDALYAFPNGEQKSVSAVAPGNKNYHGGQWAVWLVEWVAEPYLLTSYDEVMAAFNAGEISITRAPEADVKCPVLKR